MVNQQQPGSQVSTSGHDQDDWIMIQRDRKKSCADCGSSGYDSSSSSICPRNEVRDDDLASLDSLDGAQLEPVASSSPLLNHHSLSTCLCSDSDEATLDKLMLKVDDLDESFAAEDSFGSASSVGLTGFKLMLNAEEDSSRAIGPGRWITPDHILDDWMKSMRPDQGLVDYCSMLNDYASGRCETPRFYEPRSSQDLRDIDAIWPCCPDDPCPVDRIILEEFRQAQQAKFHSLIQVILKATSDVIDSLTRSGF